MPDLDSKSHARMAAMLKRILVVDSNPNAVRMMQELLRSITPGQVYGAQTVAKGLQAAQASEPDVVFVEQLTGINDAAAFTRGLRRSELRCRKAPVIVITAETTASTIIAARDAGAHEFLRKPYTLKDLIRRLEAVTLHQRDWVEAVQYIGPDRRRFNSGDYQGPRKRQSDPKATPDKARLLQALKIVRAAMTAVDIDPMQVRRALAAQCAELQKVGASTGQQKLIDIAAALGGVVAAEAPLTPDVLGPYVNALIAFMPADDRKETAAA